MTWQRYAGNPDGIPTETRKRAAKRARRKASRVKAFLDRTPKRIVVEADDWVSFIGPDGTRLVGEVVRADPARGCYHVEVDGKPYSVTSPADDLRKEVDTRR